MHVLTSIKVAPFPYSKTGGPFSSVIPPYTCVTTWHMSVKLHPLLKMNSFLPPLSVKGMKALQRELFKKTVQVPAIKVQPQLCAKFMTYFKMKALRRFGIKGICNTTTEDDDSKVFIYTHNSSVTML